MDGLMSTYRVVVSREHPWWVAVAYGEGLPEHGAATESRTIAGLEETVRDLIVLRTDADLRLPYRRAAHSFGIDWEYDLPAPAKAKLESYLQSKLVLTDAREHYADQAQQAAAALAHEVRASVRDVAKMMGLSYQRVQQLLSGHSQGTRRAGRMMSGRQAHR
jgi:hypothetical protein